jgi:hypothetical protein
MTRSGKILRRVLSGTVDRNITFFDLVLLLRRFGFAERRRGSHTIFTFEGIPEILNLQPLRNGKAKAYQVKQVRHLILEYRLAGDSPGE